MMQIKTRGGEGQLTFAVVGETGVSIREFLHRDDALTFIEHFYRYDRQEVN